MSDSSTLGPDELVLAEFALEIERLGVDSVDLSAWIERHPKLESRLRGVLETQRALDETRPETEPPLPQRLGEFRIVRRIARGGMGDIFEAIQEPLGRRVAVKTIRQGRLSPDMRDRFLREQKVLASLHQTHIVPIHTAGQDGQLQYFAMPYIEGAALHNVVQVLGEIQSYHPETRTPPLGDLALIAGADTGGHDKETVIEIGGIRFRDAKAPAEVDRSVPRNLSREYFRSVARVMADVADAVQHAHDKGILHRDIKPSNIMIDTQEQCWMIDFGLARYIHHTADASQPEDLPAEEETISSVGFVGTLQYMAPEQFDGNSDRRSDVWGLGVTLYEMLTLQRAFSGNSFSDVRQAVNGREPTRPRRLVRRLPADLDAICMKAIRRNPEQRYDSATEFADDLRRSLHDEPTIANRIRTPQRVWKWARRNKGWATAIAAMTVAILGTLALAVNQERESRRESYVQQARRIRTTNHLANWSDDAGNLIRMSGSIRRDDFLRDEAAALSASLDANRVKQFDVVASAVAFDETGTRLLIGGGGEYRAKLWDGGIGLPRESGLPAPGPVGFTPQGEPVQLVAPSSNELVLWDLDSDSEVCTFSLDPVPEADTREPVLLAMSTDASTIAAARSISAEQSVVATWDATSGRQNFQITLPVSAVGLSPDGRFLAVGNSNGEVKVLDSETGEEVRTLKAGRNQVHYVSFGRDSYRPRSQDDEAVAPQTGWLLAAGDAGGTITTWRVDDGMIRSICRGSLFDVYSAEFSPDATLIVSGGRNRPRIWDAASGELLLELDEQDFAAAITFAGSGQRIAVASTGVRGKVTVWELERGRGILTLRGLTSNVAKIVVSSNGGRVAAISHSWEVGVWDTATGTLLYVLEAPRGLVADNSALAFSPNGQKLGIMAGGNADLWDLNTGTRVRSWALPPGLADLLAFNQAGALISFRVECQDGQTPPYSDAHPSDHPRVCRIRTLVEDEPAVVAEITDFNWHVDDAAIDSLGSYVVVSGTRGTGPRKDHLVGTFDTQTGQSLWMTEQPRQGMQLDSSGRLLALNMNGSESELLDMPDGTRTAVVSMAPAALTPQLFAVLGPKTQQRHHGYSLFHVGDDEPFVSVGIDAPVLSINGKFTANGRSFVWGNPEGDVLVADLVAIQEHLAELGLEW